MTSQTYQIETIVELSTVCASLNEYAAAYKIVTLVGDLGAGKTTFVKAWLRHLGVKEAVTSPTFSIINEYRIEEEVFYHMDLYRIKHVDELYEIGIEEYIYGDNICLIEWPSLIYELIEEPWLEVEISNHEGVRTLLISERSH